jgi:hypothetical protein
MMELDNQFGMPPTPSSCEGPLAEGKTIEQQVSDFLDAKTHGEDLFHTLYDHVLDEPIPERMRALLRAGGAD